MLTMKATKSAGGEGGFPKAPAGTHPAVLVAIVDLGTHTTDYQGTERKQRKVFLCWELVTQEVPGYKGRNFVIGCELTFSLVDKATLRKFIESRLSRVIPDGTDYLIDDELGQPCLLSVKYKGDWPRVDNVMAVPKGMPVPEPQNKPFIFVLDSYPGHGPINLPGWLPYLYGKPLAQKILDCHELRGKGAPVAPAQPQTPPYHAPQNASPAPPSAPSAPPPPPRRYAHAQQPVPTPIYQVDSGVGDPQALTLDQIIEQIEGNKLDPSSCAVWMEGWKEWKGMGEALPQTLKVPPF